jgi:hypothetical protein
MIKITKAESPLLVSHLVVTLYGAPGIGKTSLAFTAEAPLLLDFDRGAHRAANRKDTVQVGSWAEVADIQPKDLEPYKTIVVDTVGRALDQLAISLIAADPKMASPSGGLSLPGFGALKAAFSGWLGRLRLMGKDVVLIAHADEQRQGDSVIERLDAQGASRTEVYKVSDAMGRLHAGPAGRVLSWDPTEAAFGKNPVGFRAEVVPPPSQDPTYLATLIRRMKDGLNGANESNKKAANELAAAVAAFPSLSTPDDYTAMRERLIALNAPTATTKAFTAQVKKAGFVWDKTANRYCGPAPAATPAERLEPAAGASAAMFDDAPTG